MCTLMQNVSVLLLSYMVVYREQGLIKVMILGMVALSFDLN
jgi:hypothetical protein